MTRRCRSIVVAVLLGLLVAQFAAQAHVLTHSRADPTGLPDRHSQLCAQCASFAPLLAMQGGAAASPGILPQPGGTLAAPASAGRESLPLRYAFRSRAPPA